MYAVIFRAHIDQVDEHYTNMVHTLRELAFEKYGCRDFLAMTEGDQEIAISYWDDEDAILRWKNDPTHGLARERGKAGWYQAYTVQVVEIRREYSFRR